MKIIMITLYDRNKHKHAIALNSSNTCTKIQSVSLNGPSPIMSELKLLYLRIASVL